MSKNLAFVMLISIQLCPIIVLATWRIGLRVGALTLLETAALVCAYLTWGNRMSIYFPTKMRFFRFAPASGLVPEIVAGLLIGSLPGIIRVYVLLAKLEHAIQLALLIAVMSSAAYLLTTLWCGRRLSIIIRPAMVE
jgi:hypothetical protein